MNKSKFLAELKKSLAGIPEEDIEKSLDFYSEMIDDRLDDGLNEEEAVAALGSIEDIKTQILRDTPLPKIIKERVKPKRTLSGWEIALIILGMPLWLPLLIAAASILFSVYIVIWSLVIVVFSVDLSFAAVALAGIFGSVVFIVLGHTASGLAVLGAGLVCAGLAVLWFFLCIGSVKGIVFVSKRLILGVKAVFVAKGDK